MGIFSERPTTNVIALAPGDAASLGGITDGLEDVIFGYVATSATSIVACRATTYTEPTTAAQRELVSASASDDGSPTGTGAHKVRIVYYDGSMNGPYTEDVTLNGTSAVATVATNIRFVERMYVLEAGSTGSNVGIITLRGVGGGATVGTIAASDGQTFWAHHYVRPNKTCLIRHLTLGTQGASCQSFLREHRVLTTNAMEKQIHASIRVITAQPSFNGPMGILSLTGPCRVTLYVRPDAVTANTFYGNYSYTEL